MHASFRMTSQCHHRSFTRTLIIGLVFAIAADINLIRAQEDDNDKLNTIPQGTEDHYSPDSTPEEITTNKEAVTETTKSDIVTETTKSDIPTEQTKVEVSTTTSTIPPTSTRVPTTPVAKTQERPSILRGIINSITDFSSKLFNSFANLFRSRN